jgi:hypothetical protein
MTELEQAERALAQAKARAESLAAIGSLVLRDAVAGGPSRAQGLLGYHVSLRRANQTLMEMYRHVCDVRAAQGLPPPGERYHEIPPDFGPMPVQPPGVHDLTGKAALWFSLLAGLIGGDLDQIARCLDELKGWTPETAMANGWAPRTTPGGRLTVSEESAS